MFFLTTDWLNLSSSVCYAFHDALRQVFWFAIACNSYIYVCECTHIHIHACTPKWHYHAQYSASHWEVPRCKVFPHKKLDFWSPSVNTPNNNVKFSCIWSFNVKHSFALEVSFFFRFLCVSVPWSKYRRLYSHYLFPYGQTVPWLVGSVEPHHCLRVIFWVLISGYVVFVIKLLVMETYHRHAARYEFEVPFSCSGW
jgi:hypothetical protein